MIPSRLLPHTLRDGRDFVPAPPLVVFGHHFASIAGLGPLLGPAIAVIWGWVPALLWIVLGCIFVGAVHDLGCMYSSLRNRARSVADLAYDVAGARARVLFLLFGIFALALAMGVFVINIANLFAPGAGGAEGGHVPEAVLAQRRADCACAGSGRAVLPLSGVAGKAHAACAVGEPPICVAGRAVPDYEPVRVGVDRAAVDLLAAGLRAGSDADCPCGCCCSRATT
jgi:hypothetical protein